MSKNSTANTSSMTDWARIDAMQDEDIDLSDIPEVTAEKMKKAVLRIGGKVVSREQMRMSHCAIWQEMQERDIDSYCRVS